MLYSWNNPWIGWMALGSLLCSMAERSENNCSSEIAWTGTARFCAGAPA